MCGPWGLWLAKRVCPHKIALICHVVFVLRLSRQSKWGWGVVSPNEPDISAYLNIWLIKPNCAYSGWKGVWHSGLGDWGWGTLLWTCQMARQMQSLPLSMCGQSLWLTVAIHRSPVTWASMREQMGLHSHSRNEFSSCPRSHGIQFHLLFQHHGLPETTLLVISFSWPVFFLLSFHMPYNVFKPEGPTNSQKILSLFRLLSHQSLSQWSGNRKKSMV